LQTEKEQINFAKNHSMCIIYRFLLVLLILLFKVVRRIHKT